MIVPAAAPLPLPARTRFPSIVPSAVWLQGFLLFQIVCQLVLLTPWIGSLRVLVRSAAYGASLLLLVLIPATRKMHPAARLAFYTLLIVVLEFFHPGTRWLAGLVQTLVYVAILAPRFWVPQLAMDSTSLRRILMILWLFHTTSSCLGIAQVYYPGRFLPAISVDQPMADKLTIKNAKGELVLRPMGLTDMPGGAAVSGFYACLLGSGFLLLSTGAVRKAACSASIMAGWTVIYLSQVRFILVTLMICLLALLALLLMRGERGRLRTLAVALPLGALLSLGLATWVGGAAVTSRLQTLVQSKPGDVYYRNRGFLLDYTFREVLPQYPLGAGLARWGTVDYHFGNKSDVDRPSIWAEIQWTAWILDGGIPLTIAYLLIVLITVRTSWRIASLASGEIWIWGAVVLAYNIGALAATFSYPFFMSQSGLELWALNGAIFAAGPAVFQKTA